MADMGAAIRVIDFISNNSKSKSLITPQILKDIIFVDNKGKIKKKKLTKNKKSLLNYSKRFVKKYLLQNKRIFYFIINI